MILTPSQIKQIYGETFLLSGKFNKGALDLLERGILTNWKLIPNSTMSMWLKVDPDTVRGNYHIFGNDKFALVRNNAEIAVVQNVPEKQCIFWSKLEDNSAEIGPNATEYGTVDHAACQFNDGAQFNADADRLKYSLDSTFKLNERGAYECWVKPNWNSGTGVAHYICDGVGSQTIVMYDRGAGIAHTIALYINGSELAATGQFVHSSGDIFHIAGVWDNNGIDGTSDTRRLYKDGILVAAHTTSFTTSFTYDGVTIGAHYNGTANYGFDGIIDNFKIWNYAKTDYSDRNTEDATNFIEGDDGITNPATHAWFHMGLRINDDRTFDLFKDGSNVHSSSMKIHEECFEDLDEKFWPEHWWKLDEPSGSTAYDSGSVGGKDGTISNAPSMNQEGVRGTCFDFNASSSQHVDIGDVEFNMKSITFWMKADSTTEEIIALAASVRSIEVSSGTITATGLTSPSIYVDGVLTDTLPDTDWHFVCITTATSFDPDDMDLGRISAVYYDGRLDDVRLFTRELSGQEVRQFYYYTKSDYTYEPRISIGESLSGRLAEPLHRWAFDERSGSTAYNTGKSSGVDGTISGCDLGEIGTNGFCFDFDSSDSVSLGNDTSLTFGDGSNDFPRTISLWIFARTLSNFQLIHKRGTVFVSAEWHFGIDTNRQLSFQFYDASASVVCKAISTGVGSMDPYQYLWTHIVMVYDGRGGATAANGVTLYINGRVIPSTKTNNASYVAMEDTSTGSIIGRSGSVSSNGRIEDVRIYDFALSRREIHQLHNLGRSPGGEVCDIRYDRVALSDDEIALIAESNRPTDPDQDATERHIRLW